MKTFLKIAGVIFLISFVVIPIVKNMLEKSINKTLEESGYLYKSEVKDAVKIMSNQLPIKIDDNTTAKSMKYDEDKNLLYYNYEITGVSKMEMENILPEIKNEQLQNIKSSANKEDVVKAKVTFKYVYTDANGEEMGSFLIYPNEYL